MGGNALLQQKWFKWSAFCQVENLHSYDPGFTKVIKQQTQRKYDELLLILRKGFGVREEYTVQK